MHLLDRVRAQDDGRHPGVVHREQGAELLLGVDQRVPHRRSGREPRVAARVHALERVHDRRVLPGARHEDRRLRAEPLVLLLERDGPRVHGHRSSRAQDLGRRDEGALRRRRAQPEAQVPHPDVGPFAARARDPVQRRAHHAAGAPRVLRQLQLAPHERLRRSDHRRRRRSPCAARWRSSSSSRRSSVS